jgi:hypothetical protein
MAEHQHPSLLGNIIALGLLAAIGAALAALKIHRKVEDFKSHRKFARLGLA